MPSAFSEDYAAKLSEFMTDESTNFLNLDRSKLGEGINFFNNEFFKRNPQYNRSEVESDVKDVSSRMLREFKDSAGIGRFIPTAEEIPTYYNTLPSLNDSTPIEERIKAIDDWKASSLEKASKLRPAESDDFNSHLNAISNEIIREQVAKDNKTSWLGDKFYRLTEGFIRTPIEMADFEWGQRFLAENMPEDPTRTEDLSSLFASGIGELVNQALVAAGTSMVAGPEAIPFVLGSMYSARYMKEGYDKELARSGNAEMALQAGVNSIPGALLETAADTILFGSTRVGKDIAKKFLAATTDEARRQILKEGIPTLGREVMKNGLSEATIGSIGADFTTGYGRYMATGDESYIPKGKDLLKGAFVEGVLGAGYSAVTGGGVNATRADVASNITTLQEKQKKIFEALKNKDFNAISEILNAPAAPATTPADQASVAPEATPVATPPADQNAANNVPANQPPADVTQKTPEQVLDENKNITASVFGSSNIAELARLAARFDRVGDTESSARVKDVLAKVKAGNFTSDGQYALKGDLAARGLENNVDFVNSAPEVAVELTNGSTESSKGHIFVKGLDAASVETANAGYGGVGFYIDPDMKGQLVVPDGTGYKMDAKQFSVSMTPKKGYTAVKVNSGAIDNRNQFYVVNGFSLTGVVQQYTSEIKEPKQGTMAQANAQNNQKEKDVSKVNLNTVYAVIDDLAANTSFSESGRKSMMRKLDIALNQLSEYAKTSAQNAQLANELFNELMMQFENVSNNTTVAPPDVQQNVAAATATQSRPIYPADVFAEPEAAIMPPENTTPRVVPNTEFTLGPDADGKMFKLSQEPTGAYKVTQDGVKTKILGRNGVRAQPSKITTTEDIANDPAATFTDTIDNVVVEHTVDQTPPKVRKPRKKKTQPQPQEQPVEEVVTPELAPSVQTGNTVSDSIAFQKEKLANTTDEKEKANIQRKIAVLEEMASILALTAPTIPGVEVTMPEVMASKITNTPQTNTSEITTNPPETSDNAPKPSVPVEIVENTQVEVANAAPESKSAVFMAELSKFIASLNEKGQKAWEGKTDAALKYFESGADRNVDFGLNQVQLGRLDEIIKLVDSSLGKIITREQNKNDKVTKDITQAEQQERKIANKDKVQYSIPVESSSAIDKTEIKKQLIKRGIPALIVDTESLTPLGHKWSGKIDFFADGSFVITVNAANISSIEQLDNVVNEELAHSIFNNEELKPEIDAIIQTTEVNRELTEVYNESELVEESVVKRVAALVDQYNGQGAFSKFTTRLSTWFKEKLGITLNEKELGWVAARAIQKAIKAGRASTFNSSQSTGERFSAFPTSNIFGQMFGTVTEEQREAIKQVTNAINKKLEQKLIINEPEAWNLIRSVKFRHLELNDLRAFNSLVNNFVNTRSNVKDPGGDVRLTTEEVIMEANDLVRKSREGWFEAMTYQHPFLVGKDFYADFQGRVELVNQLINDSIESGTDILPEVDKKKETWQARVLELQEFAMANRDLLVAKEKELFDASKNTTTTNSIISTKLDVLKNIMSELFSKDRKIFRQYVNSLMLDPMGLEFKDLRKNYYALQSLLSDGYALNISNFISEEMRQTLSTSISEERINNAARTRWGKTMFENAAGFSTNIRALGNDVADFGYKLTESFRSGIDAAERLHAEFTQPLLKEMMAKAVKANGNRNFNNEQLNNAGIYALARQFKAGEEITAGLMRTKAWISESISKNKDSLYKKSREAAIRQQEVLDGLFAGITEETPNDSSLKILEDNASKIIGEPLVGYVRDVADMFEATKPLAKYSSEFAYGRVFEEWVNYIPAFAVHKPGFIKVDMVPMQASVDDWMLGETNADRSNITTGNLGSLELRTRFLGDSKMLVFNINNLAENRMRLNTLDYLTASSRRELSTVISGKGDAFTQFAGALNDPTGGKERASHMQKTIRNMWNNSIQSASFISEFQAGANYISSLWASTKLSSLYQLPAQALSNAMPFFIKNMGNPKAIASFFEAANILLKYRMGKELPGGLSKVTERVLNVIEARKQDAILDKSIALDVDGKSMLQTFKSTKLARYFEQADNFREAVMFFPFKFSDIVSGAPMMLAEYLESERKLGRATDFESISFNQDSYFKALDETERFIGIGASSRRGVWLNNKNGWISLTRNMISAFTSHRINNATNFRAEINNLLNGNLTRNERMQSARYMTGIIAQSATFSLVKFAMLGAFYSLLSDKMWDEEEEKRLQGLRAQIARGDFDPAQKKIVEAEIAFLEKTKNELARVKDRNSNLEVLSMNFGKDVIGNAFVIPAAFELPLNAVIHLTYDKSEAESFKLVKESALADLESKLKLAKASKNTSLQVQLETEISRWNSQEAVQLVYDKTGIIPFDGTYGGVLRDTYNFLDSAAGAGFNPTAMSMYDMMLGLGAFGIGQADLNRAIRLYSKREEYEKEYQEKLARIQGEQIRKNNSQ